MMPVAIIGAGLVGLASAAALARRGFAVTVIERHRRVAQGITARNSGVIHAGIYYPPGSLKAALCVAGRQRTYERCQKWKIAHRKTGKLIVATDQGELTRLEELCARGIENGAGPLTLLSAAEVERLEPRVRACGALFSPETGIVDAHGLTLSFLIEAQAQGATLALRTTVRDVELGRQGWHLLTVSEDGEPFTLDVPVVINAAGLGSEAIARAAGVPIERQKLALHLCKGDYFSVAPGLGRLTEHLVYPVPREAGLGIHTTFDLAGAFRLGPDTDYVDRVSYDIDEGKAERFAAAVRPFLPEICARHLSPDYAGVRPKLQGPGEPFRDFVIAEGSGWGTPGIVHLLGIESPGLTAAIEIGERVAALAVDMAG